MAPETASEGLGMKCPGFPRAACRSGYGVRPSRDRPHGLDLDAQHRRAFVPCDGGNVIALDLETGREVAGVAIPGEPDATWYNADRSRLYLAVGRPGLLAVVDTQEMTPAQTVATEADAHTTAFDRTRQLVYVFLPRTCRAAVYQET
jgi:hypothetical protein